MAVFISPNHDSMKRCSDFAAAILRLGALMLLLAYSLENGALEFFNSVDDRNFRGLSKLIFFGFIAFLFCVLFARTLTYVIGAGMAFLWGMFPEGYLSGVGLPQKEGVELLDSRSARFKYKLILTLVLFYVISVMLGSLFGMFFIVLEIEQFLRKNG
ncbi:MULTISPECIES: hypothetical protein [unclassified Marinovum]